jgi:hypothetical protein
MYLSLRMALIRNLSIALVNGAITLVILLIAPLGLAAVMINTLLVTIATYATASTADRTIRFLQGGEQSQADLLGRTRQSQIRRVDSTDLDRR